MYKTFLAGPLSHVHVYTIRVKCVREKKCDIPINVYNSDQPFK